MAVKIIQKGKPKETTCGNCGSLLSYEFEDVKSFESSDYAGGSDTYHTINCPHCHKSTYVKEWRRS